MKLRVISLILLCFLPLVQVVSQTIEKGFDKLIVFDKKKSYPNITLERENEPIYVPLETTNDILIDKISHVYYVSDKRILIVNKHLGDVFLFDLNGKVVSHFNGRGGLGYNLIGYAVYDEKNEEIYILDKVKRKIFVFNLDGGLKRTLQSPQGLYFSEINNFDDQSLLAFHEYQYGTFSQKQPYMFISKEDGSIISRLNINLNKANPTTLQVGENYTSIGGNFFGNCKYGDEYILFNMSCDTIYSLSKNKVLTPLFVQKPTVFTDPPIVASVRMKTDDFIIFTAYAYDLKAARKSNDKSYSSEAFKRRDILYNFKTEQFFTCKNLGLGLSYTAEKVDIPENTSVEMIDSYLLKRLLERGRLDGELKEIATKRKIDDNPVIIINKFK